MCVVAVRHAKIQRAVCLHVADVLTTNPKIHGKLVIPLTL